MPLQLESYSQISAFNMPRPHFKSSWIKRNHCNSSPRKIIALDCEANRVEVEGAGHVAEHKFRLAVARSATIERQQPTRQQQEWFTEPTKLWEWIYDQTSVQYTTWLIAHGMFYDFRISAASREFDSGALSIDAPRAERTREQNDSDDPHTAGIVAFDGLPFIVGTRVNRTGGRMVFVDLLNWFRCPLRDLGIMAGKPKMQMPDMTDSILAWKEYCEQDVEILFETFCTLIKWCSDHQMGMFRYTAASQAMSCFRHGRMPVRLYPTENTDAKALERESYFGGRIECFRLGRISERVHLVDVNSMYPSVMKGGFYPTRLEHYEQRRQFGPIPSGFRADNSVARCDVQTDRACYPTRTERGICYPTGRFTTTLCGRELAAGIRRGDIAAIADWAVYDCASIFDIFVSDLWNLRQQHAHAGQRPLEQFAKLLLNSLHGKFAQWQAKWQATDDGEYCPDWRMKVVHDQNGIVAGEYFGFAGTTFKKMPKAERSQTMPIISAFISANVRMRMNYLREIAGVRNVYYQGVDSLLVNDDGMERLCLRDLLQPNRMGYLKLKSTQAEAVIYGCSRYELGNQLAMSGLPSINTRLSDDTWAATRFGEFRDLFRGVPADSVIERIGLYSADVDYVKGNVRDDGWVDPLCFPNSYNSGCDTSASVP